MKRFLILGLCGGSAYGLGLVLALQIGLVRPWINDARAPAAVAVERHRHRGERVTPVSAVEPHSSKTGLLPDAAALASSFEVELRKLNLSDETPASCLNRLIAICFALAPSEFPAAWAMVRERPNEGLNWHLKNCFFRAWSRKDPRGALEAALALADVSARGALTDETLAVWAEHQPEAALDWAHQRAAGEQRHTALVSIIRGMAERDPATAVSLLTNLPGGEGRNSALAIVVDKLAGVDLDRAVSLLGQVKGSREPSLTAIARASASRDISEAVTWAGTLPTPEEQATALGAIVRRVAETEPDRALELVKARPDQSEVGRLTGDLVRGWASTDLAQATAWVGQLPEGPLLRGAWKGLTEALSLSDRPQAAVEFALDSLPPGETRDAALRDTPAMLAWMALRQDEPLQASEWASQLPPGPERDSILSGMCSGFLNLHPEEAAELASLLQPGPDQAATVSKVARFWSLTDPEGTATWGLNLSPGAGRTAAISAAVERWGASDPATASEWLESVGAADAGTSAAEAFVRGAANVRPDLAAQHAGIIADEDRRNRAIETVAQAWLRRDWDTARAWLQGTALPEERKARLIAQTADGR